MQFFDITLRTGRYACFISTQNKTTRKFLTITKVLDYQFQTPQKGLLTSPSLR